MPDAEDAVADVVQGREVGGGGLGGRVVDGGGGGGGGGRVEGGGVPLFQPRAPPLHLEAQVAGRLGKLKWEGKFDKGIKRFKHFADVICTQPLR